MRTWRRRSYHDAGLTIMLAGKSAEAQKRLADLRPYARHRAPKLDHASGINAITHHLVNAGRQ